MAMEGRWSSSGNDSRESIHRIDGAIETGIVVGKRTNQWLPLIQNELTVRGYPFPPELITALIQVESAGKVGTINKKSGASGLMQVMPIALKEYNRHNPEDYKMGHLRGKTDTDAAIQIRVGTWILGHYWRLANKYLLKRSIDPTIHDLSLVGSMFYVAGPRPIRNRLGKLERPDANSILKKWGDSNWKPIVYAKKLWSLCAAQNPSWNYPAVKDWLGDAQPQGVTPPPLIASSAPNTLNGLLLGLMILAVAAYYLPKKGD